MTTSVSHLILCPNCRRKGKSMPFGNRIGNEVTFEGKKTQFYEVENVSGVTRVKMLCGCCHTRFALTLDETR